jgi:ferredoxin
VKPRVITADQLNDLLDKLAGRTALYAPVKVKDWTEFRRVRSHRDIDTSRVNTRQPVKTALFPQREVMLRYEKPGAAAEPEAPAEQAYFGVRPCDAAALAFLEKFFGGNGPTDPYVQSRRAKTTVITLACNSPADTCFCVAVGGGPSGTRGTDLLLSDIGGRLVAEPQTAKGEALVRDLPEPSPSDLARKKELADKAAAAIPLRIDTAVLKKKLDRGFEHAAWEALCLPCVNCGACTFLCPTCHCFDVTDEERKGTGARIRVWDSCQFCMYSQHASGHNPRVAPQSRYRNRVLDKFKYTLDQVGELSCVGCGRCVLECPAAIDVRETVDALARSLPEK